MIRIELSGELLLVKFYETVFMNEMKSIYGMTEFYKFNFCNRIVPSFPFVCKWTHVRNIQTSDSQIELLCFFFEEIQMDRNCKKLPVHTNIMG